MWDLWWTKWHWVRFSPSTLVSPANSYPTYCSTLIIKQWRTNHVGCLTPPQEMGGIYERRRRDWLRYNAVYTKFHKCWFKHSKDKEIITQIYRQHGDLINKKKTNKPHGLSPRANYTDRATAACRRSDCHLLRIKGATWSA
jgi:hypothetical protein